MTTKERLEIMVVRLEKEQKEIITAVNETESIYFIISMGKQAEKNQQIISFARATLRPNYNYKL